MPLDPQARAFLNQLEQMEGPGLTEMTPDEGRAAFGQMRQLGGVPESVSSVEDRTIPGPAGELGARVYKPSGEPPFPVMVFFHGGGFVFGDLESHDSMCRTLTNASGSMIVAVDYRLAPEHKFPAAVDDCYAATEWIYQHAAELGGDAGRVGVAGDSAGGNLAAVVSLLARDRRGPKLAYQLLIYPATDLSMHRPSVHENGEGYFLTYKDMVWFEHHYIRGEEDRLNPLSSPMLAADHAGLPPAIILTAEFDPLRDEGEEYGEKLRLAGVPVKVRRHDGMIHGYFQMFGVISQAQDHAREVGADVRRLVQAKSARIA